MSVLQLTLGCQKQLDQPKRGDSSLTQIVLKLLDGIHDESITDPPERENIGFRDSTATFNRTRQPARPRPTARLSVEALDDRVVPTRLSVADATIVEGNSGTQYAR